MGLHSLQQNTLHLLRVIRPITELLDTAELEGRKGPDRTNGDVAELRVDEAGWCSSS